MADFAAVIAIGQSTMRTMLRALYITNKIKHVVPVSFALPGGFGTLTGELFLGLPVLTFADGRITLDIHLWGRVTAPLPLTVELTATVQVGPTLTVATVDDEPQLQLGLDGATATVRTAGLSTDPVLPPGVTITPAQLAAALQPIVRGQLSGQSPAPISLASLGGLTKGTLTPTARARDGVLLIGLDVAWPNGEFADSSGDVDALRDIRRGGDVAMYVSRDHVRAAFSDVIDAVAESVAAENAVLDRVTILPRRGAVHVHGVAHNDDGTATFDFDITPVLTVDPRDDRKEKVRFESTNIDVSVNPSLGNKVGAALLGALTFGWVAIYADDLANAMRASIAYHIKEGDRDVGNRVTWFTLPGTTSPPIKLRVQEYRVAPSGTFVQIKVTPLFAKPRIIGVSRLWADRDGHVQTYCSVDYPPDVLADDPQLRVAWTLTRGDTGEVVGSGDRQEFRADVTLPGTDPVPQVTLSVLVTRRLATSTRTVFQSSATLFDRRLISRDHPYVRWLRGSVVPWVHKEADGSLTPLGLRTINRPSAIHRTDVPHSCLFIEPQGASSGTIDYTYLDDLPFPADEIAKHRGTVCDYCFFGGPTNTRPLPLPAAGAG